MRDQSDVMREGKLKARWPVTEFILLLFLPVPFTDSILVIGNLQPLHGRMPEWIQLSVIFITAPFILLSSSELAFRAFQTKHKRMTMVCMCCAAGGAIATAFVTGIVATLGAGIHSIGFAAAGIGISLAFLMMRKIKWMSPKDNEF